MILVLLGTQNNSFQRLLEKVDQCIKKEQITEEVVVQAGYTKYESKNMKIFDFIPKEELEEWQQRAKFIITHGGVGSIIQSITKDKKVIAIPRLHQYQEHVNDHQKEIVEIFNEKGYIIGIQKLEDLEEALKRIKDFKPKKYTQNHNKMLKIIEEFIDNC